MAGCATKVLSIWHPSQEKPQDKHTLQSPTEAPLPTSPSSAPIVLVTASCVRRRPARQRRSRILRSQLAVDRDCEQFDLAVDLKRLNVERERRAFCVQELKCGFVRKVGIIVPGPSWS